MRGSQKRRHDDYVGTAPFGDGVHVGPCPARLMSIWVFFVRRLQNLQHAAYFNSSRPITGSSLPALRVVEIYSVFLTCALYVSSDALVGGFLALSSRRSSSIGCFTSSFRPRPASLSMVGAGELTSKIKPATKARGHILVAIFFGCVKGFLQHIVRASA